MHFSHEMSEILKRKIIFRILQLATHREIRNLCFFKSKFDKFQPFDNIPAHVYQSRDVTFYLKNVAIEEKICCQFERQNVINLSRKINPFLKGVTGLSVRKLDL